MAAIDLSKYSNTGNHLLESRQDYDKDLEELESGKQYNTPLLEGTSEEVCPTCGQEVDQDLLQEIWEKEEERHTQAFNYITKIKNTISHKKEVNKKIEEKQKQERRFKELFSSIDQIFTLRK